MIKPNFNTFGASVNKIWLDLFEVDQTIPKNIVHTFKSVIEKVKSKEMEIEEAKIYLGDFGESVEKVLLYRTLILMEKEND